MHPQPSSSPVWPCLVSGVIATVAGLCVYLSTLNPYLAGGDSGELMVTAFEMGTPHPPGYPSFAMLSKAAVTVSAFIAPSANLATAMNGFHAVLSSLALGVIASTVTMAGGTIGSALLAAGMFGFAPNVWTYAIATEVFPLNNLFSATIAFCAVDFEWLLTRVNPDSLEGRARIDRAVATCSFVYGLALTNQHTSLLFVAPIVLWVFFRWPSSWRSAASLMRNSLCFFLGLSPYLYLPLSNYFIRSPNSWGRSFTLNGFLTHFLRKEYGTFSLVSQESTHYQEGQSLYARNTRSYFLDIVDQLGPGVAAVALLAHVVALVIVLQSLRSWWASRRGGKLSVRDDGCVEKASSLLASTKGKGAKAKGSAPSPPPASSATLFPLANLYDGGITILFLTWACYANFFNSLCNLPIEEPLFYGVQQRFWIQPLIITAIITGVIVGRAERGVLAKVKKGSSSFNSVSLAIGALALYCSVASHQLITHYAQQNESSNTHLRDYCRQMLDPLPSGAVLFTSGDQNINCARYAQTFEGVRADDILVLDQELLTFKWFVENARDFMEARKKANASYPFSDFVFPGDHYFPNSAGAFSILDLIKANTKKGRRFFNVGGLKEGDAYASRLLMLDYGHSREAMTHAATGKLILRQDMRHLDAIGTLTEETIATLLTRREDIIDRIFSLPDAKLLHPPSIAKYAPHTWEYTIGATTKQSYHNTGFALLNIGQRLAMRNTQPTPPIPRLARYIQPLGAVGAEGVLNRTLLNSLPTHVAALLGAHIYFRAASDCFGDYPSLGYESARNAAAALQELMAFEEAGGAMGKTLLVPHLMALLNFPSHSTLTHDQVKQVISAFS